LIFSMNDYNLLEKSFIDKKLLQTALTHRSWVNEHKKERRSNERLEFLGDAILEYIVSDTIYKIFDKEEEGYLTALRAKIVNTVSLAKVSEKFGLGECLFLSKGEEETGGRTNQSLLADTFEAVVGAIYLDQGLEKCRLFLDKYLLNDLDKISKEPLKDSKSQLQELVQAKGYPAPKYQVVNEEGPDHSKIFTIEVIVEGKTLGMGIGKSKSEAAQKAASDALNKNL